MSTRIAIALFTIALASGSVAAQPAAPDKFALLVGVNEYDHADLKKLKFAENDVSELNDVLKKGGYQVTLLTGKNATKTGIETKLAALAKTFPKNGTLIVALAGHGLQFEGDDDNYFCPVDARPFKDKKDSLVSIKWVYERLQKDAAAGPKFVLVDACRNDPKSGRGRGIDAESMPNPPRGVALLMSCSAGETAWEHDSLKHGVFFHHVIQGLGGKAKDDRGEITWDGLRAYVKREVSFQVPKLIGDGATQTPEENGRMAGAPPVLLVVDAFVEELQLLETNLNRSSDKQYLKRTAPTRIEVWKSGAERGSPSAQVLYGRCLEKGIGVAKDEAEAVKLYQKAADTGNLAGMTRLGDMYANGRGVIEDKVEAVRWFKKAADAGNTNAMLHIGFSYLYGTGEKKDGAEAIRWFQKAIEAGGPDGMTGIGLCYLFGDGVEKDGPEAVKWFRKAADAGSIQAMCNVGYMYGRELNLKGVKQDYVEAMKWHRKAAEAGSMDGMYHLGSYYEYGLGVPKNEAEAIKWYSKAIDDEQYGRLAKDGLERLEKK